MKIHKIQLQNNYDKEKKKKKCNEKNRDTRLNYNKSSSNNNNNNYNNVIVWTVYSSLSLHKNAVRVLQTKLSLLQKYFMPISSHMPSKGALLRSRAP
jgi:hypothetical protein